MFTPCAVGYGQILVIAAVVLLLFGGRKIPELMRGLGRGMREFKDAMNTDYTAEERKTTAEKPEKSEKKEAPREEDEK